MQSEYGARLHQLIHEPATIKSLWTELRRPFLRWFDYEPVLRTEALEALYEHDALSRTGVLMERAWQEFGENLLALEQNQIVYGQNDAQDLNWLQRIYGVLVHAQRSMDLEEQNSKDATERWLARRRLEKVRRRALLPLKPADTSTAGATQRLAGIDAMLDAADAENNFLGRRRKLLEGARELLLVAAESVVGNAGVQRRLNHITHELGELSRLQSSGVKMEVALAHQLSSAVASQSTTRLSTLLTAVEHTSMAGDGQRGARLEELSSQALSRLWGPLDRSNPTHRQRSISLSGQETLQAEVGAAITQGYENAKSNWESHKQAEGAKTKTIAGHIERYLNESASSDLIHASLYVDACVDVGGVLSPHRVYDIEARIWEVPYPTQKLTLRTAESVQDIPNAVISDPRTLMLDLATGRLLTRRYLGQERYAVPKNVMASEVRIFLMDGSGSMLGNRARMRDAILVAELSTMIARLNQSDRWLTPSLYYRYFDDNLGPVHEVHTSTEAIAAVEHVLGEVRWGGTDIQGALEQSFDTLRQARASGDELAHAQIVLVTDGEADVDEKRLEKAREGLGDVPIGVSIIALGQENPALRRLAARQRSQGERVFYQFVPDALIRDLVRGKEVMLPLHLPDSRSTGKIDDELRALVREIEMLQRQRDDDALSSVHDEISGLAEVGLSLDALPETERTRILALSRDAETLRQRFDRWFPELGPTGTGELKLAPSDEDEARLAELEAVIVAVAETTDLSGGTNLRRQSDAVEMLERLLQETGMTFRAYERLLQRYPSRVAVAVTEVRRVAGLTTANGGGDARQSPTTSSSDQTRN